MNGKALYPILVTLGLVAAGAIWQASAAFTKAEDTAKTVETLAPAVADLKTSTAVLTEQVKELNRLLGVRAELLQQLNRVLDSQAAGETRPDNWTSDR